MSLAVDVPFRTFSLERRRPKNMCTTGQTPDLIGIAIQFLEACER